ncbi:MAG: NAD(+)/NADH kinase [Athalassotoga sp.]|uniref:NAD(+)/NADH kinase n=1 Tax=Athalassotoga sp. TaxID=2022597 RepID=UPI003D018593
MSFDGITILANEKNAEAVKAAKILKEKVEKRFPIFEKESITSNSLVFILGGDGTVLRYSKSVADKNPLIVGINFGHLGFLSPYDFKDIDTFLEDIFDGRFYIMKRNLSMVSGKFGEHLFLNDFLVQRDIHSHLINATISIDGVLMGSVICDGMLVSTSTGSTAYNLSAGGPIIDPKAPVLSIVPMMAHTLLKTPVIVSTERKVEIKIEPRNEESYFALSDGDIIDRYKNIEIFEITGTEKYVKFICDYSKDFFKIVNQKLAWGARDGFGEYLN